MADERVEVILPDGRVGTIPAANLRAAVERGAIPVNQKAKADPITPDDVLGPVTQGATFGFSDELAAGIGAGMDAMRGGNLRQSYDRRVAHHRGQLAESARKRPLTDMALNLVGSLPTMAIPGLGASRGATLAETAMNAIRSGAKAGALAGAGAANGGLGDRMIGAGQGAAVGAAVGGVIPTASRVGGAAVQRTADAFADSGLGQAIGKLPGVIPPGAVRGAEKVVQSMEKDGLSPIQLGNRLDELSVGGKPAVLADAGREAMLGRARGVVNAAPAGAADAVEKLAGRADDAGARTVKDLLAVTGMRDDAQQVADALMRQRSAQAAPLYAAAYQEGAEGVTDPTVLRMLQQPEFKSAVAAGYRLAAAEGVDLPKVTSPDGKTIRLPNLQALDYIKRGLDDILYSGKRTGTIGRGLLRALEKNRQAYVDRLDELYPTYAKARSAYAGDTKMLEAIEAGQRFVSMDEKELGEVLQKEFTSPAEREHFLLGAVDSIKRSIAGAPDGSDIYSRVFRSETKRNKLRSLFPSESAFKEFASRMSSERRMRRTWEAVRGNSTTVRQSQEMADLGGNDMLNLIPMAATGNWSGIAGRVANRAQGDVGANAAAALPILFGDPKAGLEAIVRARQLMQRQAQQPIRTAAPAGVVGGLLTNR